MDDVRVCSCGSMPKEYIGEGFPVYLCGIELSRPIGTYLYCPVCGVRTNSYSEPVGAYGAWNRMVVK